MGRKLLLEAFEEFEGLGAGWDAARLRRSLRRLGVGFGHRRGRKGYGDQLSPREAEIVAMAAEGRTNREIAEALFLSVRTVDAHMSRAIRKLGVSSRRDLAAAEKIR
jgi:DNA-binding CsgD family transcriptional regulator